MATTKRKIPYHLELTKRGSKLRATNYDFNQAIVVMARSQKEARAIAQQNGAAECQPTHKTQTWVDPTMSTCVPLSKMTKQSVILIDFTAG